MTARKLRRVINEVRGKAVKDAKVMLRFMPYFAAKVVEKNLIAAIANAKALKEAHNFATAAATTTFAEAIAGAKTILWNGPAGVFECDDFTAGSRAIGEAIAKATAEGAFSLIGGGDSVACVNKFGLADQVSYISTGGGALLEAIEGKVLPGIAAIKG